MSHASDRVHLMGVVQSHVYQRRLQNEWWTSRRARRTNLKIAAVNCCMGVRHGSLHWLRWTLRSLSHLCTCCTAVDSCANGTASLQLDYEIVLSANVVFGLPMNFLSFFPLAFENAARHPNSDKKLQCCDDPLCPRQVWWSWVHAPLRTTHTRQWIGLATSNFAWRRN